MKKYNSIPRFSEEFLGQDCIAFYKYDGSLTACEWSPKKGWHKWATRGQLFDDSHDTFGCALEIFERTLKEPLDKIIKDNYPKAEGVIAFMEFQGPHSFAGLHEPGILQVASNDPKELVLFDVNIHKKGIISPKEFVKNFSGVRSAEVVYEGQLTDEFVQKVRKSEIPVNEGVVCKFGEGHKLQMCKIKSWSYLKKIQKFFGTEYGRYWE